jgi:hypothetical protein
MDDRLLLLFQQSDQFLLPADIATDTLIGVVKEVNNSDLFAEGRYANGEVSECGLCNRWICDSYRFGRYSVGQSLR